MYKDKEKQKEANRVAAKKYRDSMTGKGMTVSPEVIPSSDIRVIPKRGKDIKCFEDLPLDEQKAVGPMPPNTSTCRVEDGNGLTITVSGMRTGLYPSSLLRNTGK